MIRRLGCIRRSPKTFALLAIAVLVACGQENPGPAVSRPVRQPSPPPTEPPELTVGETTRETIALSWSEAPAASGYELERRPPFTSNFWELIYGPGTQTSHRDEGLRAGYNYGYRVRAHLSGNEVTRWSSTAVATTTPDPPPTPTHLTAGGVSPSTIELRWTAVARVTRYRLQRRPEGGDGSEWVAVALVDASPNPVYRDGGLSAGTDYEYRVRSELVYLEELLRSGWSERASASTDP